MNFFSLIYLKVNEDSFRILHLSNSKMFRVFSLLRVVRNILILISQF